MCDACVFWKAMHLYEVVVCRADLGGGFNYVDFSLLFVEDVQFDSYFFRWVEITNRWWSFNSPIGIPDEWFASGDICMI